MSTETKKWIHTVAFALVIIGAIDLGLFGIMPADAQGNGFDFLQKIFGFSPTLLEIIYALIGISGIYLLATYPRNKGNK